MRLAARSLSPTLLAPILIGFLLYASWIDLAVLDPRNVGWLLNGNDQGQNTMGLVAYLRAAPPWPSLHDPLLMAPEGLGVALTDSNPLLAILLRPFAGWLLPDGWQYTGLWLLACFLLQAGFARALLKPFAHDALSLMVGTALLAGAPVLLARYGHMNLCAQWVILWALWLFIDERRSRMPVAWATLLAVAGLIHPYILAMAAAIWGSACLRLFVIDPPARLRTIAGATLGGVVLLAVPAMIGFFDEPLASTHTYGRFGLAIDALWNAGNGGYSTLLPSASTSPAQGFEGMNYLGAGILLLIIAVAASRLTARSPAIPETSPSLRPLLWLLPAFAVLTAIAIAGQFVWQGKVIATLGLSQRWIDLLDPLRASGRMFWPVYYTIMFVTIAMACRLKAARPMLLAALLVQTIDIAPMVVTIRLLSSKAQDRAMFDRTPDPRWDRLVAGASAIEFHPYEAYRDLATLEQIGWRAITACRPVPMRYFYASREPGSIRARMQEDSDRLARGEIDPTRLYVFLKDKPPAAVAARAVLIDGTYVIAPSQSVGPSANCR